MTTRAKSQGRRLGIPFVLVLFAVLTAGLVAAGAALASSSALTVAAETVNWKWLAIGLGGAAFLVVLMWVLQRYFFQRRDK